MSTQMEDVLGVPQILELIEAEGEFLQSVKKEYLTEYPEDYYDYSLLSIHYKNLELIMEKLSSHKSKLKTMLELLAFIPNLEFPLHKNVKILTLHQLYEIKEYIYYYNQLYYFLEKQDWLDIFCDLKDLTEFFEILDPEGFGLPIFVISSAYSDEIGDILNKQLKLIQELKESHTQLLEKAKKELQIPYLKDSFTVSRAETELADRIIHSPYFVLTAENVANYSFALADDEHCLELKKKINNLQEKLEAEEHYVLQELTDIYREWESEIFLSWLSLRRGAWKILLSNFAFKYNCSIPVVWHKKAIIVKKAVNLPLKRHLESMGRKYQPVDYEFSGSVSLLTGPNMGGKTTVLKTIGQFCTLLHYGIPLPCESAELPLFKHIWYNQSETDNNADLSSFGREVVSFTQAIQQSGTNLFLLDEFARGTNPIEGELLVSAVLQYLATTRNMSIAATHFSAPTMLPKVTQYSIAGLNLNKIKAQNPRDANERLKILNEAMDYSIKRLKKNEAPPLNAINVARILGMPEEILKYTEIKDK
jgi:DNA mismatch repair ATPase MutS